MVAQELIDTCAEKGILLWRVSVVDGDEVRFRAPRGVLTPLVMEKLRELAPRLLPLLPDSPPLPEPLPPRVVSQWQDVQDRQEESYRERTALVVDAAERGLLTLPKKPFEIPVGGGSILFPINSDVNPNAFFLDTLRRRESFSLTYGAGFAETPSFAALVGIERALVDHYAPLLRQDGVFL